MLHDVLHDHIRAVPGHAEVRAQTNTRRAVSIVSGNLVSNVRSESGGVSARAYKNGVWGFSSTADYDEEAVKKVIKSAQDNALFLDSRAGKGKPPLPSLALANYQVERDFVDVPQKIYIDAARQVDAYIAQKYPALASRSVVCRSDSMEKLLKTSEGGFAHSIMPRAYIYVFLSTDTADGETLELFEVLGGGAGYFTDYYADPSVFYDKIDRLYEQLMQKRQGVFPEAGVCDCILDASLAGMLAHEAVGHTVEADLVLGGSVAGRNLGKPVASELITMIDFAHTALGEKAPLPLYVDEEGTVCKDEVLIKDGILTGYMNNRETAVHFGMEPKGNARAHEFSDEPLIRMRNTAILPGKNKLEEMISAIDHGYYFLKTGNGQADTTGEFMFGITFGYEIKNGKIGAAIRDTTIAGVAFEMLKTVDMLSDDMHWDTSGYCGKKQLMPVSMGGPAIKCKMSVGGR
ncbi:MAG: TldD/PmbA family protein [Oscillospiraceae bacterium]|jgi:TldD protein|nr:TldD/PmbA family protein [Oscillospiraceae bacterium]